MVQLIDDRETTVYNDLDDAITGVAQIEANYKDYVGSPSDHIHFSKDGVVSINGDEMRLTENAYGQFLSKLG